MSCVLDSCEGSALLDAQWAKLIEANEKLASAKSVEAVIEVLRDTARAIVQSDGIAVVIREDDKCFYAAEDAIAPLWASRRFPVASCISGWAMMNRQTVAISDVYLDSRIPQEAYRPTFVRSLVMVPIGAPQARAAIGAYWSDVRTHAARTIGAGHRSGLAAGPYIRLAVADTGRVGNGTRLGLSMVHGLASQLGGALLLNSTHGRGTEVELWLPVSADRPTTPAAMPTAFPVAPGVALLVDDEDLVRSSIADMLVEMGFQVIESHCGEDALQKLARLPHVDLLVTDHLMPAMTGPELARVVRRERPRTAIVIISGYSEAADMPAELLHLEKPFLQADLAATVARALNAPAAS